MSPAMWLMQAFEDPRLDLTSTSVFGHFRVPELHLRSISMLYPCSLAVFQLREYSSHCFGVHTLLHAFRSV